MAGPGDGSSQEAALAGVLRGYCRWQRPDEVVAALRQLGGGALTDDCQRLFMQRCFEHDAARKHPPPPAYRLSVLKALALAAEGDGCEADESLTEALEGLLTSGATQDAAWGWKTFFYAPAASSGPPLMRGHISLRLSRDMLAGSTGCFQWEAGLLLGQHILSCPGLFAGRKVQHLIPDEPVWHAKLSAEKGKACLELGCGAGLVGVCLHRAGATSVVLTDGSAEAVSNCHKNLLANCATEGRLPAALEVRQLSWEAALPAGLAPDVVVGADLLYDSDSFPALVRTLAALLLRTRDAYGFLACCERDPGTLARFQAQAAEGGLLLEQVMQPDACMSFVDALTDVTGRLLLYSVQPAGRP